ncbi:MAG: UDP-N-acetylmuramate:L-alanyl-gamma-D-glutamyl-meso-diaminopimelate ligase [Castellaniella sp.]
MHLHILGICGTFMGGLALIARSAGHTVTGCDSGVYPPMSTQLEEQGIRLIEGFDATQTALGADLYVVGNVVSRGNPLMEAILDQGLPYVSGPQWLGEQVLQGRHVLAVAGTHGKTTTSAMLAWILEQAGRDPGFLIGGIAPGLALSARLRAPDHPFVIEADEYDTAFFDKRSKFVHYRARTLILNHVEYDHADIFPDLAAIETQFHHLMRTVPAAGLIIRQAPDAALDRVLAQGHWTPVQSFGPEGQWQAANADARGHFDVVHEGGAAGSGTTPLGRVQWSMAGEHNQRNALAAIAAAAHLGISPAQAIEALSGFTGVKRRLELRGAPAGIEVYDDFAHHPTAIALTLEGLRRLKPQARIIAVLEPRSNTMKLGTMAARLPDALVAADLVACFGAASGRHALGWNPADVLAPLGERATCWDDVEALTKHLAATAQPGDAVVIMSNGSFGGLHERLLTRLADIHPADTHGGPT